MHPKDRTGDLNVVSSQGGESGAQLEERAGELNSIAEMLQSKSSNVLGKDVPFEDHSLNTAHLPRMDPEVVKGMTDSQVDAERMGWDGMDEPMPPKRRLRPAILLLELGSLAKSSSKQKKQHLSS